MPLFRALDTVLDRSVVLGYGRPGLAVRRRLGDWEDLPRMDGRVVAVTGAGSGIGLAAAEAFAGLGADVVAVVRDAERAEPALAEARRRSGGSIRSAVCDVSSLDALHRFTDGFLRREPRLDVLVNNAGVMPPERTLTADGIELTFATHVLGPFVLVERLAGLLAESDPGRIITVASGGMYAQRLDPADFRAERPPYRPAAVYARAKRAQVVLTEQWAARLGDLGVVVHAMHPGWADTPGVATALPGFRRATRAILRTPAEGADTIVWLAAAEAPARTTGRFWHDRRPRPTHLLPTTRETPADRAALWDACVALTAGHTPAAAPTASASSPSP